MKVKEESEKVVVSNKGLSSQGYGFSCGHVWMWELDCEDSWVPKNWWFWTMVLEKTLERSIQSFLKETSPGCSLEGLRLRWKLQYFGHLMQRVDSLEKTLTLGGIGGRRRRDDRGWDGWMALPTRLEFGWTLGVGDEQGGLACCSSRGRKESDTTERLNWTDGLRIFKSGVSYYLFYFRLSFCMRLLLGNFWKYSVNLKSEFKKKYHSSKC